MVNISVYSQNCYAAFNPEDGFLEHIWQGERKHMHLPRAEVELRMPVQEI